MKQKFSILSALFCIAFLFASCLNPTQSESGKKSNTGNGGSSGGGGYWSAPTGESESGEESESDVEEELPSLGHNDFLFDIEKEAGEETPSISLKALEENNTSTVATLKLPKTGGPWSVALDEGSTEPLEMTSRISPSVNSVGSPFKILVDNNEGEASVVLKGAPEWGLYTIVLVISGKNTSCRKTLKFVLANTPAPFKSAPIVYPYITGMGENKLEVSWGDIDGAEGFNIYVSAEQNRPIKPYNKEPIGKYPEFPYTVTDLDGDDDTEDGLPDGTIYYVWVGAYNDSGEIFSPPAVRKTSATIPPMFYWEDGREDFYSWDSYTGSNTGNGGVDFYRIIPPEGENYYYKLSYGPEDDGMLHPYRGYIHYFAEFDNEETKSLAPRTQTGKWGEPLNNKPAGVFIIKYDDDRDSFLGIYYWGAGATQTTDGGNFGPGFTSAKGLELCYFSNSWGLGKTGGDGNYYKGNPDAATLPIAIDRFSLENMNAFIAFVATPWYRKYGPYDSMPDPVASASAMRNE